MPPKTLTLFVITHTETHYNRRRIFSGHLDSHLTPLGRKQAQVMAQKLKLQKIGLAFISPLSRTRETLKPIRAFHPEMKIYVDPRIIERDYGQLEKKSKVKYKFDHPDLYPIYHRSYRTPPPGGESMVEVEKRVRTFLKDVIQKMKASRQNALIIGHNNSTRPIRRYFEKLTPQQVMHLDNRYKIFRYRIKL